MRAGLEVFDGRGPGRALPDGLRYLFGGIEGNGTMNDRLRSAGVIALVVLMDRLTKIYIREAFTAADLKPVIPGFFNIVHTENPGAAFGMLADSPGAWRGLLLVGVSLVVMIVI